MDDDRTVSRRSLLRGGAALAGLAAFQTLRGDTSAVAVGSVVNVPSDQPTLQGAFEALGPGVRATIHIESGHTLTVPVELQGGDWTRVTVTADGVVPVDPSHPDVPLIRLRRCAGPTLACLIDADGNGGDGVAVEQTATVSVEPGCGVLNAGRSALAARTGASVFADGTVWTGAAAAAGVKAAGITAVGARIHAAGADVSDSHYYGAQASHGGWLSFRDGHADRAGRYGLRATNGGNIDCRDATADGCTADGLRAFGAGIVNARGLSARNCGQDGITVDSSVVSARDADVSGCDVGLRASRASKVDFSHGVAAGCVSYGLYVLRSSEVDGRGCTVTSTGGGLGDHGAYAGEGATVNLLAATVSGSSGNDLRIFAGGTIVARDCTTSSGAPALANCNVAAFNVPQFGWGIVWA